MIRDPQSISTVFTGLSKRRQGGRSLRFRLGSSPCHCFAPAFKKASFTTSAYTWCQGRFAVQPKNYNSNLSLMSFSLNISKGDATPNHQRCTKPIIWLLSLQQEQWQHGPDGPGGLTRFIDHQRRKICTSGDILKRKKPPLAGAVRSIRKRLWDGKMTGEVRGRESPLRFCYPTRILMQRSLLGST
jgi:hypothetical protein